MLALEELHLGINTEDIFWRLGANGAGETTISRFLGFVAPGSRHCGRASAHSDHLHIMGSLISFQPSDRFQPSRRSRADARHADHLKRFVAPRLTGAPGEQDLRFEAVCNSATGETVSDTAQFTTQFEGLKTTTAFDAVLPSLTVRTETCTNVLSNLSKGNDTDEEPNK